MKKVYYLFLIMLIGLLPEEVSAQFSSGSGIESSPYEITTVDELNEVRNYTESHFILMNDLDFDETAFDSLNSVDHKGWMPIDNFTGNFNGNSRVIKDLFINSIDYKIGLFGDTYNATILNLGLENCRVSGEYNVGGLVGSGENITVINCYSTGRVFTSSSNGGGLIGSCNTSTIESCYSNADVAGLDLIGGLIGRASDSTEVRNCYATGIVDGRSWIAGLVGYTEESTYINCYSIAKIPTIYQNGLIGNGWKCSVKNSYWDTDISGALSSNGGEGKGTQKLKLNSTFSEWDFDSVWVMAVNSEIDLNRRPYLRTQQLPGYEVEVEHDNPNSVLINGEGLYNDGDIVSLSVLAYNLTFNSWKQDNSAVSTSNPYQFTLNAYNPLVYTADFTIQNTPPVVSEVPDQSIIYVVANRINLDDFVTDLTNFDYEIEWSTSGNENFNLEIDSDRILIITGEMGFSGSETITLMATDPEGLSASVFIKIEAYNFSGGQGTETDPFQITTINQLDSVRHALKSHYLLMNDLDFMGSAFDSINSENHYGWEPIGDYDLEYFTGSFDGNGQLIKNLYIDDSDYNTYGLFGSTHNAAIKNVGIVNCNITGDYYTGALIGYSVGTIIESCYVTGKVEADAYSGGLIGQMSRSSVLNNCYSMARVSGHPDYNYVGGLVGNNYASLISNCYSAGKVTGDPEIGGLVGQIDNYSSSVADCFYNSETTGLNDVEKGNPLPTSQMKNSFAFVIAGWDFNSVWGMENGKTYPSLQGVDNVPFIFNERVFDLSTITFSDLLANDYDYETGQENLILEVKKLSSGSFLNNQISLPNDLSIGDSIAITYRIGEVRQPENDVLWTNTVTSWIIKGNQTPNFTTNNISLNEDNTLLLGEDEFAFDADNDAFSVLILDEAVNGLSVMQNGFLIYTPNDNFHGDDSVQIKLEDYSESVTAWIYLNIESVNDVPVILSTTKLTINEDASVEIAMNNIESSDADGDFLSVQVADGEYYSFNNLTVTPDTNFNGTLFVNVSLTDLLATSDVAQIEIEVAPVNDAPIILSTTEKVMDEDDTILIVLDDVQVSEVDGDEVTLTVMEGENYTVVENTVVPEANFNGNINVALKINDGVLDSEPGNLSITVNPINDDPVLSSTIPQIINEDNSIQFDLSTVVASDIDEDVLSVLIEPGENFTIEESILTPDANFHGIIPLVVKVSDGVSVSDTMSLQLTVNSVNDVPFVIEPLSDITITEQTSISISSVFSDVENDNLSYDLILIDEALISAIITDGVLQIDIVSDLKGTVPLIVSSNDGNGGIGYDSINVTVDYKTEIDDYLEGKNKDLISTYPNPFNNELSVRYNLSTSGSVELILLNLTGAVANSTDLGFVNEGEHSYRINTESLNSGIYFMKVISDMKEIGTIKAIKVD